MKTIRVLLAVVATLSALAGTAQSTTPSDYSLLWRISGNGLTSPSYLFGTMHLRDPQVFMFADSVLPAIRSCDYYATEVHPDSVVAALFRRAAQARTDTADELREMLPAEVYNQLSERIYEERGVSMEQLNVKKPWVAEMLLTNYDSGKDERELLSMSLDEYLMSYARGSGCEITGLESMEDHNTGISSLSKSGKMKRLLALLVKPKAGVFETMRDDLLKAYSSGSVDTIQAVSEEVLATPWRDSSMHRRNMVMAASMDSLMRKQKTFAAIGVGHLPGDVGVLELLRERGYTCEPVPATFDPSRPSPQELIRTVPWLPVEPDEGYRVQMPGKPTMQMIEGAIPMWMYPNLVNGMSFMTFVLPSSASSNDTPEDVAKQIMGRMRNRTDLVAEKIRRIKYKEMPGVESYGRMNHPLTQGMHYHMRMVVSKDRVFVLMATGRVQSIESPEIGRFLESLEVFEMQAPAQAGWKVIENEDGAFAVSSPGEFLPSREVEESDFGLDEPLEIVSKRLSCSHQGTGMLYMVQWTDQPAGMIMDDDTAALVTMEELLTETYGTGPVATKWGQVDGLPYYEVMYKVQGVRAATRTLTRGNRMYLLMAVEYRPHPSPQYIYDFFDSFEVRPWPASSLKPHSSDAAKLTIDLPGEIHTQFDTVGGMFFAPRSSVSVFSSDTATASAFIIECVSESPYFQTDSPAVMLQEGAREYLDYNDSLVSERFDSTAAIPSLYYEVQSQGSGLVSLQRHLISGTSMIHVSAYVPNDQEARRRAEQVLHSLRDIAPPDYQELSRSKAAELCKALCSNDEDEREKALQAVGTYDFAATEIPMVLATIDTLLQIDSTEKSAQRLLRSVHDHDTLVVDYVIDNYKKWKTQGMGVAGAGYMAERGTPEGWQASFDIIQAIPAGDEQPWRYWHIFAPYNDSLALCREYLPQIIKCLERKGLRYSALGVLNKHSHDSGLTIADMAPYQQQLDRLVAESHALVKSEPADSLQQNHIITYAKVPGLWRFTSREPTLAYLHDLLQLDFESAQLNAALALIDMGEEFDVKKTPHLLKGNGSQYAMQQRMHERGVTHLLPGKYWKQAFIAQLALVQLLEYDYGTPDEIKLIGRHETILENERVNVYAFRYAFEWRGELSEYIGIAGPQPLNNKAVSFDDTLVRAFVDYDKATKDEVVATLIREAVEAAENGEAYEYDYDY